jgi:hypothetical protein
MDIRQQTLIERLRIRARIRRQIPTRRSVQNGEPDRIADLLEEAANEIERLENEQHRTLQTSRKKRWYLFFL